MAAQATDRFGAVVVVGAGQAGLSACTKSRDLGHTGKTRDVDAAPVGLPSNTANDPSIFKINPYHLVPGPQTYSVFQKSR